MIVPSKRLDSEGKCCGARPMKFSKSHPFCASCYAEFGPDGAQVPNWCWRPVAGGFTSNRAEKPTVLA